MFGFLWSFAFGLILLWFIVLCVALFGQQQLFLKRAIVLDLFDFKKQGDNDFIHFHNFINT